MNPLAYLSHVAAELGRAGRYMLARANEPSTWTGVVAAVTSVATVPYPLYWIGLAGGVIAVLVRRMPAQ